MLMFVRYIDELSKELRNQFPLGLSSEKDDRFTPESEKHNVVHIYYKVQCYGTPGGEGA